ncbi:MAG: putative 4-hydroxybenzoate polyprenyltransferase [Desulfurococcales archaeon]|nr:putative 4-hydroxybenzoate polyprenyltransferase [Desulfurococcales archaeon]
MNGWDPGRVKQPSRLHLMMRLIRIEHTLFSLPFAYLGAVLSCPSKLDIWNTLLIGLAVLGLRTASMAYNNIADLDIDKENPRTSSRPLVSGIMKLGDAWFLVVLGSIVYFASAILLNETAFMLSPILWILAVTYPHHKRYSPLAHYHLGLVLGFVVFGGAVAVCPESNPPLIWTLQRVPWTYLIAVTLWVAGFDIPYSIQDAGFDRSHGLHSIPAWLGKNMSLWISRLTHLSATILFLIAIPEYHLGIIGIIGTIASAVIIYSQHYIIYRHNGEMTPVAFNLNLLLGLILTIAVILDVLL